MLWEIGEAGADVRELRTRLGLDSGYLSRLLTALQGQGLVTVEASIADRRVRVARLTAVGQSELRELEHRSDSFAADLLDGLSERHRSALLNAMAEVERLFTATLVEISRCDPAEPDARHCLRTYFAELAERFEAGFDPGQGPVDETALRPPAGVLLVARLHGVPVGCGALVHTAKLTKVKRMWVDRSVRGLGVGRRLLTALEDEAIRAGVTTLGLETNRALPEAIAMYASAGYQEVEPFDDEPYAHHWFTKSLEP